MTASNDRQMRGIVRKVEDLAYERNGEIIVPKSSGGRSWKQMFDIDEAECSGLVLALSMNSIDTTSAVSLRGVPKVVGLGSGWTLVGDCFKKTLTAWTLVYLRFVRATATVTIMDTATLQSLGSVFVTPDDYAYRPLWIIKLNSTNDGIDFENCVSLRESFIIDGIS